MAFDLAKIIWSPPDGRITPFCSYCQKTVPDVPLRLWTETGWTAHFCDDCATPAFRALHAA